MALTLQILNSGVAPVQIGSLAEDIQAQIIFDVILLCERIKRFIVYPLLFFQGPDSIYYTMIPMQYALEQLQALKGKSLELLPSSDFLNKIVLHMVIEKASGKIR